MQNLPMYIIKNNFQNKYEINNNKTIEKSNEVTENIHSHANMNVCIFDITKVVTK